MSQDARQTIHVDVGEILFVRFPRRGNRCEQSLALLGNSPIIKENFPSRQFQKETL